jgi:hypothetical protein
MQGTDTMGRLRDLFREEPEETTDQPTPSDNTDKPNWLVTPDEAKASQDEEERLAAMNENEDLAECGPMGMPSEVEHHTPASINMTADSGPELSGMLADIMKLAGVHKVEPEHLGIEHDPVVITAMPGAAVGAAAADHSDMEHDHDDSIEVVDEPSDMRRMMDMMNPDMDDEVDESGYTNTPNDPNIIPEFDPEIYANHENQPDQGDRMDGNMPRAFATMEERLMSEWKQFVTESHYHQREISVNGKEVDTDSLEIDGIDMRDYVDAYFSDGQFMDGTPLSQDELDYLKDHHGELLYNKIQDRLHESSQSVAEGEGKTQKYEMMLKNGQVKKFIAKDDADAKRIAAGHSAKSVIKMKGDVPGDKIAEQGVAEGGEENKVKSIGNDVNPATGERCDYYINPVTGKKVYCKPGQKVSKGDHVTPSGTVKPKV